MQKYVVLLRGINVGGNNKLPMKELVPLLQANHYFDISTYIQTGNIVLTAAQNPEQEIKTLINKQFGFMPNTFVLTTDDYLIATKNNPFTEFDGKLVHLYFCHNSITLNTGKVDKYQIDSETIKVVNNVFYLHAPDGIGRSKLVANIEACLGQAGTGRNLNTVNKITLMIGA